MEEHSLRLVNASPVKVDGIDLVTGAARYTDDYTLPGMLHATILASPHAHARITRIDTAKALALPGVQAVLTHHDVPRVRHTNAGQSYPEPSPYDRLILDDKVRFVGDRVAVVAADSLRIAEQALALIEVEYEVLPAVFDPEAAMRPGAPIVHDETDATGMYDAARNIAAHLDVELGSVAQAFADADLIVEGTYRTQRAKHCALETHGSLAYLDEHGRVNIITSTQVPFHTRRQLAYILNLPMTRIRVMKPRMGGGFGNKQGMFLEDLAALLTLRTKRPVKLIFSRAEEFSGGYSRHPQSVHLRTGVKRDGTLVAQEMRVIGNTGAYGDHAPTVQECTGRKVLPLYHVPNARFTYDAVYTNLPVSGAFRGYGAIQGFFALESQMDEIAAKLGIDPLELRRKNHIRQGDTDLIAHILGDREERVILSCGLDECIERGAAAIGWHDKRAAPGGAYASAYPSKRRGVGMACAMQGSGIAGVDWGSATIALNEDGTFTLYVGATDLGTGSDTILSQIAAEALGVALPDVYIIASDTDLTPFDVGAYASSTTYVSGGAVKKAADMLRADILAAAADMLRVPVEDLRYRPAELAAESQEGRKPAILTPSNENAVTLAEVASHITQQQQRQLTVTASNTAHTSPPPFTAQFAEVEVDLETGQVTVLRYVAAVDCGVAINPTLAEGQVEGAVTQGLGFALCEEMLFDEQGRILNPNFADYKLFNAYDMPALETILVETHETTGPYGAKSVAEVPINCPAPAIANAIFHATGLRLRDLPLTAEKILRALNNRSSV